MLVNQHYPSFAALHHDTSFAAQLVHNALFFPAVNIINIRVCRIKQDHQEVVDSGSSTDTSSRASLKIVRFSERQCQNCHEKSERTRWAALVL